MSRKARRWVAVVLGLVVVGALVAWGLARGYGDPFDPPVVAVDSSALAPAGVRIRVQVLNASGVRGQARRATMELRDRGFDVVEIGNASERRDTTLVLSRLGEVEWAERVARALGEAQVEERPDSTRYVEVSVLLGRDWHPPPGPFRP